MTMVSRITDQELEEAAIQTCQARDDECGIARSGLEAMLEGLTPDRGDWQPIVETILAGKNNGEELINDFWDKVSFV